MQTHNKKIFELKKIITDIKVDILDISFLKNAHHIGSIFSCIDILVVLYFEIMNIQKRLKNSLSRDYFFLSLSY